MLGHSKTHSALPPATCTPAGAVRLMLAYCRVLKSTTNTPPVVGEVLHTSTNMLSPGLTVKPEIFVAFIGNHRTRQSSWLLWSASRTVLRGRCPGRSKHLHRCRPAVHRLRRSLR